MEYFLPRKDGRILHPWDASTVVICGGDDGGWYPDEKSFCQPFIRRRSRIIHPCHHFPVVPSECVLSSKKWDFRRNVFLLSSCWSVFGCPWGRRRRMRMNLAIHGMCQESFGSIGCWRWLGIFHKITWFPRKFAFRQSNNLANWDWRLEYAQLVKGRFSSSPRKNAAKNKMATISNRKFSPHKKWRKKNRTNFQVKFDVKFVYIYLQYYISQYYISIQQLLDLFLIKNSLHFEEFQ